MKITVSWYTQPVGRTLKACRYFTYLERYTAVLRSALLYSIHITLLWVCCAVANYLMLSTQFSACASGRASPPINPAYRCMSKWRVNNSLTKRWKVMTSRHFPKTSAICIPHYYYYTLYINIWIILLYYNIISILIN